MRTETEGSAGACGLYCGACAAYIATREDPERLALLAARRGETVEEIRCEGCRSQKPSKYCETCDLIACANQKGHEFCVECADFPCLNLEAFGKERPHRAEILQNLRRIGRVGSNAWVVEVSARYACPECGVVNSAYDLKCRKCGHDPGSPYAADHADEVRAALARPPVDK
jgi:predicted RNA-binding Zn-ribbon protein involved in translation (DUF1610 family)